MPDSRRKLPVTASVAKPAAGGKLSAPSALRNRQAIVQAIRPLMPVSGTALEIASGTGEHVVHYATAFEGIMWLPTELAGDRLASIRAWCDESGQPNILPPRFLDAANPGWAGGFAGQDVIIFSNLLHLVSDAEAGSVLTEAAQALAVGGVLLVYGPFLRGAMFASENDQRFHESLRASDPNIGYKSFQAIQGILSECGLAVADPVEMPANNLLLTARKP